MGYFNNLTVEELLKELKDINSELLQSTKNNSIKAALLWPMKIRELVKEDDQGFNSLREYTIKTVDLIEEVTFNMPKEAYKISLNLRRRLIKDLDVLKAYEIYLINTISYISQYAISAFAEENFGNSKIMPDVPWIKDRIYKSLSQLTRNPVKYFSLVRDIIAELPMGLTKDKTFEIIKNSLQRNLSGKPDFFASISLKAVEMEGNYRNVEGFGEIFKEVFQLIEKLSEDSYEGKSSDELKLSLGMAEQILTRIRFYKIRFKELGISLNHLITYTLIDDYKADTSTIKTIETFKNLSEDNRKEEIDRLERSLAEDQKYQNNKIESFNQVNKSLILGKDFNPDSILGLLNEMRATLLFYNDSNFMSEEDLNREMIIPLKEEEINSKIDQLIERLDKGISQMAGSWRKIALKRTLMALEVPFIDINQFLDFVDYSLTDKALPKKLAHSKILIIDSIIKKTLEE